MFSMLQRYREVIFVGALLVYPLITFLSTGHKGREPNVVDRAVLWVSAPLEGALTWTVDGVAGGVNGYVALRGSHEESLQCRVELSQTMAELNSLKEAKAENERLKKMLGYVENTVEPEIAARVIGINPSPQYLSLRLNRGEDDGVRVGMPVITPDGVVGQVVRAVGSSCDVMLVSDPSSKVGAVVQRTRARASAVGEGDGASMALSNVPRDTDVQDGDVVITAGTDGVFPRGLMLGTVDDVKRGQTAMFLSARVVPAVNLRRVEEVLVVPVNPSAPSALLPGKP